MLFYQGQLCSGKVFLGELTECREEELEVYLSAFSATFFLLHQQASYNDLKSYCCSPSDIAAAWPNQDTNPLTHARACNLKCRTLVS